MADYAIHDTTLTGIANVIRKKDGTQALIDPADYADRINLMGMLEEKTVSGSVASCSDGADEVPLSSWTIDVDPTLAGKSQIVASHGKKNFIPLLTWLNVGYSYTNNGVTFTIVENGGVRITGKTTAQNYSSFNLVSYTSQPATQWQFYVPKGTYTYSLDGIISAVRLVTSGSGNNGFPYSEVTYSAQSKTGTVSDDTKPFNYVILRAYPTEDDIDVTVYPQLEAGSTATSYEPYSAPIANTVNLGQTIYGGKADVVNGTGTANTDKYDLGDFTWNVDANRTGVFYTNTINDVALDNCAQICDSYTVDNSKNPNTIADGEMCSRSSYGGRRVFIKDLNFDGYTGAQVKTALEGKYAVLLVDTPTDFTFTPISPTPETYLNSNCFWGDTGDSEVVYRGQGTVTVYPNAEEASF